MQLLSNVLKLYTRWWVLLGCGTIGVGLLAGLIGGVIYFETCLPNRIYAHLSERPWLRLNVNETVFGTSKDFAQAEKALLQLQSQPGHQHDPVPSFLLGELYRTLNRSSQAISQYRQSLRLSERSWYHRSAYRLMRSEAHASLAIIYYDSNLLKTALSEVRQVKAFGTLSEPRLMQTLSERLENPERADCHLQLAQALRHQMKLEKARQELIQARDLSQNPQLRLDAVHYLQTQMPQHITDLSPLSRYYTLAAEKQQYDDENFRQAATYYEKALRETPRFEWGYHQLARVYRELKDYRKANFYAQKAIALNPDFYNSYLTLGDIALDRGQYQHAIAHYKNAQAIIVRLPDMYNQQILANIENQIGYSYETLKNFTAAYAHYRLAMYAASQQDDDEASAEADYQYALNALARVSGETKSRIHPE